MITTIMGLIGICLGLSLSTYYWRARTGRLLARAHNDAQTDELTGLLNRRGIMARLQARQAHPTPWSIILIDVDAFKAINDTFGHLVGDATLKSIAARIRDCARPDCAVGRLGGDEFVVILPGSMPAATTLADTIVAAASRPIEIPERMIDVSVSVGCAGYTANDSTSDLLRRADRRLYAKKTQRHSQRRHRPDTAIHQSDPRTRRIDGRAAMTPS